jgi:hypothetical protein
MGAWGVGLYSSDFALDLRSSVGAVARLPFEPDRLLDLLQAVQPTAANDPKDPDHTLFWLVTADQFAKRGVDCPRARGQALGIIASGSDLEAMRVLGLDSSSLKKRSALLEDLRSRLADPLPPARPRAVLKAPQKLLLEAGEVVIYPICKGKPINPYAVGKEWAWVKAWRQDAWGALVVAERGLVFGFLAWYRPLVITDPFWSEPALADLMVPRTWSLGSPGTLTTRHYRNMQMRSVGRISIDGVRMEDRLPNRGSPLRCVVSDISLCNTIAVGPISVHEERLVRRGYRPNRRIEALAEIALAP